MVTSIPGGFFGNQNAFTPGFFPGMPQAQASTSFTGPFGVSQSTINGMGTSQVGPFGVSSSVPWAPGFGATPANTSNSLGLTSPFATVSEFLNGNTMGAFGQNNPFSPLIGTPIDLNNGLVMATGAFGGFQNPMSPFSGLGLPQSMFPDGSFGFGGPGGSQPGNFGGFLGAGNPFLGGNQMLGGNGMIGNNPMLGGNPFLGGTGGSPFIGGNGVPFTGGNQFVGSNGFPFAGSQLGGLNGGQFGGTGFGQFPGNTVPGFGQSFGQFGGNGMTGFNSFSDGIAKLFLQGGNAAIPRQMWGGGTVMRSPLGIFETGIGWAGGHANAGIFGTQATGMSWAMVRNPINPGMIVNYSNPFYNRFNFNQGFSMG